jgi:putative FmdB family regulatory protein
MPLYEYKCIQCGAVTEVIQKVSDTPLEVCAQCGGRLRKQVSSPAIQFKGSGWYVTDYAGKKPTEPQKKTEKTDPPKAPKTSESQKEAASDEKSTSTTPAH